MALPRSFQVWSLVSALVLAAGCATVAEQSPEQVVKARAQARWDALVKGDIETAYSYLGPGSRAVNSLDAYKASVRKGFWTGAEVESVKCEAESCEVSSRIEYQYRGGRFKTPLAETWVKQQGNWWYVLK